eukprot:6573960-Pyramimonas_sp.AAC.1
MAFASWVARSTPPSPWPANQKCYIRARRTCAEQGARPADRETAHQVRADAITARCGTSASR